MFSEHLKTDVLISSLLSGKSCVSSSCVHYELILCTYVLMYSNYKDVMTYWGSERKRVSSILMDWVTFVRRKLRKFFMYLVTQRALELSLTELMLTTTLLRYKCWWNKMCCDFINISFQRKWIYLIIVAFRIIIKRRALNTDACTACTACKWKGCYEIRNGILTF